MVRANTLITIVGFFFWSFACADQTVQDFYKNEAIKCDDISCIRKNIDQINNEIIALLVKRTGYVQRAGDLKLQSGIARDQNRIDKQLQILSQRSEKLGLPKEISLEAFQVIMKNSTQFEQDYINKKAHQNSKDQ